MDDRQTFEDEVLASFLSLVDRGLAEAKLDNEGEPMSLGAIERAWYNVRLRDRIMLSLTEQGRFYAELELAHAQATAQERDNISSMR
jgi:hypothetical protein